MKTKQERLGTSPTRGHSQPELIIPTGAIAQLAERRTRIAEVESSSLFRSTTPRSGGPRPGHDSPWGWRRDPAPILLTCQRPAFFVQLAMMRPADQRQVR